ncbi:carbohydrate-binding protein [Chitinophagaceae bacterium LB-8]|uniref:Carbohydrate-binding protein n=1 Tax=Paraflavisolibacter caeni TaxID=2982496 RepID=A0A9X2XUF5_9BACT|nr:kelch repeat-containing protein [Paraflavisolibacter caeni]MCU7549439.1 carbohydrate-binding protein [Paraflavisolibacter caeni]
MKNPFTPKKPSNHLYVFISLILVSAPSFAQWQSQPNGWKPRSEVTSVVYNGKVYAFFGFRDSAQSIVEPSAEVFDPLSNTWTLLDSVPPGKAVTHAAAALIDDNVWHIGGRVGKHPGPLTSEIWIYNITANSWSPGPQLIDPATGNPILWAAGGAAFLGRTLHIFGGFIITACNDATLGTGDQQKYHLTLNVDDWSANPSQPAPWKNESAPMPVKRNHLSTVVLGGKIYAIGGQFGHDCGGGQDKQYSHVYNPVTNTWTALPSLPTPRSHTEGSTFAIDGKIYVVGGQATNGASTNKVTIFNPAANNGVGAWKDDTSLTLPKVFETLSAKVIDNTFVISHGGQPRYNNPSKVTYSRTLSRTPVYKLGFLPECENLQLPTGSLVKTKALLFTIDGSKEYTTSSDANWLAVTKNATGTAIQNAVDMEAAVNTEGLAPGTYRGTITATGTENGASYTAAQYCVNLTILSPNTLEAENAFLNKVVVASNHPGYTGTGFGDYINNSGDYIEWTVNKPGAGAVSLQFRYANGSTGNRALKLEVNRKVIASALAFPPTGAWNNWSTVNITANLMDGVNKVRLTAIGSSGANIDHLVWSDVTSNANLTSIQAQDHSETALTTGFKAFIAPNPASGLAKLTLQGFSHAPVEIKIANTTGGVYKTFSVRNVSTGQVDFSVQDLPAGVYVIFVRQGNEQASTKLMVTNH